MIRTCEHEACGEPFEAKRADARFCGAGCRAAASRARRTTGEAPAAASEPPARAQPVVTAGPDPGRLRSLEARVESLAVRLEQMPMAAAEPDPEIAARLVAMEARVESLLARIGEGQSKAARELAAVARELGQDRDGTNERVADLIERVDALEAPAKPDLQGTASRRVETRLAEIDEALRRLKRKLGEQDARITALDESAAAIVNLLAEAE